MVVLVKPKKGLGKKRDVIVRNKDNRF